MPEGLVKFYDKEKGFGFISNNNSLEETFFHVSDVLDSGINPDEFADNMLVSFDILVLKGKSYAIKLVIIGLR